MEYKKETWQEYKERLISYDYTEEQISEVKRIRESFELCPYEQFRELFLQGVIVRLRKVKKPRNYYVNDLGEFLYLDHYSKSYQVAAEFKTE